MRTVNLAAVVCLMVSGVVYGQQKSADEQAVLAMEAKWDAASRKSDSEALGKLFADEFVTTDGDGKVRTKEEVLRRVKSGEVKYQSAAGDDLKVYMHGDTAVVTGRWQGKYVDNGKSVDGNEQFTDVFVRQNGAWKCVASHSSNRK
jgi:uncharacterized protein (TIGR02246 family)